MGKSRNTHLISDNIKYFFQDKLEKEYTTDAGVVLDTDILDSYELLFLQKAINSWVSWPSGRTPDEELGSIKELKYIDLKMEETTNSLTRLEKAGPGRTIKISDLQSYNKNLIGKKISLGGHLKAFSRTREATDKIYDDGANPFDTYVIFKTEGTVRHFNINKWNNVMPWEKESWVSSDQWEITGVKNVTKNYAPNSSGKVYEVTIKQTEDKLKEIRNEPDMSDPKYKGSDGFFDYDKYKPDYDKYIEKWL